MTALLKYDAACRAVAEAKSFDEVREWEDKAAAVKEYSRRAGNREMELDALEIRERARRRRGELLIELRNDGLFTEGRPKKTVGGTRPLSLGDLEISKDESSRDQRLADLDAAEFEQRIAWCRASLERNEKRHALDVLGDGPINGARAVMGSRVESDDSADYFPTPPWATRALFNCVFPRFQAGQYLGTRVWEPACGAGHMAEVIAEFAPTVIASDLHKYGYGLSGVDFLNGDSCDASVAPDWIITNPPFEDKGEQFVLRALQLVHVGVAMFFRLQWLETVGRYERVFKPFPPVVIAQFAERVPLHKDRWEPKGKTATAYLWIVWLKAQRGTTEFFWIPPGQRERLTYDDDVQRFTVHPVIRKKHKPTASSLIGSDAAAAFSVSEAPAENTAPVPSPSPTRGTGASFHSPLV